MKRFAHVLAFLLIFSPLFESSAALVFRRSAGESYRDAETGLTFPPQIGEYSKTRVCLNQDPVFGSKIRYENEAGDCADVYLYALDSFGNPVDQESFEQHFRDTRDSILRLPKQSKLVKEVSSKHLPPFDSFPHCALFRIRAEDEEFDSLLYMALVRGRIVKVRLSAADNGDLPSSALEFLNELAMKVR